MKSLDELYRVLELEPNAPSEEIKRAYRRLAKKYHPDLNQNDPDAEEKFKKINEAYEILSDPNKKKEYMFNGTAFNMNGFHHFRRVFEVGIPFSYFLEKTEIEVAGRKIKLGNENVAFSEINVDSNTTIQLVPQRDPRYPNVVIHNHDAIVHIDVNVIDVILQKEIEVETPFGNTTVKLQNSSSGIIVTNLKGIPSIVGYGLVYVSIKMKMISKEELISKIKEEKLCEGESDDQ